MAVATPSVRSPIIQLPAPGAELIDHLIIEGGHPIHGEVAVRGAKNSISKQLVAALLTDQPCTLGNVPRIADTRIVSDMLRAMGVGLSADADGAGTVERPRERGASAQPRPPDRVRRAQPDPDPAVRPPAPPHRRGADPPGGRRRDRPAAAELPPDGARTAGCHVRGTVRRAARQGQQTHGLSPPSARIPSVGATEQVLLAAVLAEGVTELEGAAVEPEILDLIAVLQKMGAAIYFTEDRTLVIHGQSSLNGYAALGDPGPPRSRLVGVRGDRHRRRGVRPQRPGRGHGQLPRRVPPASAAGSRRRPRASISAGRTGNSMPSTSRPRCIPG